MGIEASLGEGIETGLPCEARGRQVQPLHLCAFGRFRTCENANPAFANRSFCAPVDEEDRESGLYVLVTP